MWRTLLAVVVGLSLWLTPVSGQTPTPNPGGILGPSESERPPPPLPWAVVILCTAGIMVIVCMPSRKS